MTKAIHALIEELMVVMEISVHTGTSPHRADRDARDNLTRRLARCPISPLPSHSRPHLRTVRFSHRAMHGDTPSVTPDVSLESIAPLAASAPHASPNSPASTHGASRRARSDPRYLSALGNDSASSLTLDAKTTLVPTLDGAAPRQRLESMSAATPQQLMAKFLEHACDCGCDSTSREEQTVAITALLVLIERERKEFVDLGDRVKTQDISISKRMHEIRYIRARLVESIVMSGSMNQFSVVTSAMAVRYLDYILVASGYQIQKECFWVYQLLASACNLIAAKFEEPAQNQRRNLARRLQNTNDISFDTTAMSKMEAIVLRELGWNAARVTPFCFIPYFLVILDCYDFAMTSPCPLAAELRAQLLHEAEVLTLMVLYEGAMCSFESSVVAKAIICILIAKFSSKIHTAEIVEPIVMNIFKKLDMDADADDCAYVIARVKECVDIVEALKESLHKFGHERQ